MSAPHATVFRPLWTYVRSGRNFPGSMARDSLFGEGIVWSGRAEVLSTPPVYRALAWGSAGVGVVAVLFAVVVARGLGVDVSGMLAFAAWCATLALLAWRVPRWWQSKAEYLVTDKHVIWRRGALRRTIERSAISYARIRWHAGSAGVGDLVLVRAVPTGALRRTLSLTLTGVRAPDRVWALVRGVEPPLGDGARPLPQRLDAGERVLWSGTPKASPWTTRRAFAMILALFLLGVALLSAVRSVPPVLRVLGLHTLGVPLSVLFVAGVSVATLLVAVAGSGVFWWAAVRPRRLASETRYFVTTTRVLICRGQEELSLDRSRIAYVIATEHAGLADVFLVLDGPQARALAPGGAFGEAPERDTLLPVLSSIEDGDGAVEVLRVPEALNQAA